MCRVQVPSQLEVAGKNESGGLHSAGRATGRDLALVEKEFAWLRSSREPRLFCYQLGSFHSAVLVSGVWPKTLVFLLIR